MRRRVVLGSVIVFAIVLLVLGSAYVFQRRLIYLPGGATVPEVSRVLPGAREVSYRTSDGLRLTGWFVRGGADGPTVLAAPGNAGSRATRAPLAAALAERGLSVLLVEYRGYGGNPGSPSEQGLARDIRAAHGFLTGRLGVPAGNILYYGESLGTGVVTELAAERPPSALVLRSPFTELTAIARRHYPFLPVGMLLKDRYPVSEYAGRITAPTTVVYGTTDSIVPPSESRTVAGAFAGEVRTVEVTGAGHNDAAMLDGTRLIDAIVAAARHARD